LCQEFMNRWMRPEICFGNWRSPPHNPLIDKGITERRLDRPFGANSNGRGAYNSVQPPPVAADGMEHWM
jgi:hypothetical protein